MNPESRIWEICTFGSMRGGRALVIGLAFQPNLSYLLYNREFEHRPGAGSANSTNINWRRDAAVTRRRGRLRYQELAILSVRLSANCRSNSSPFRKLLLATVRKTR